MAKAVFLDRDDTLNPDPGYISNPDHLTLYPWVAAELGRLKSAGYLLVVVTNQSGVGRGLIDPVVLETIHQKLNGLLLLEAGIRIDHFAICTHRPDDGCDCRKPKPKLILDAAKILDVELQHSYMIGDRETDVQAGAQAGLRKSFLIQSGDEASFRLAIAAILESETN